MTVLAVKDNTTGLYRVKETRAWKQWASIPRYIKTHATSQTHDNENTKWFPKNHIYQDSVLSRVRCWKCGTDLKAWRMMIDAHGNSLKIGDKQAVAFLPLPNQASTPFLAYLPLLKQKVVFNAQHCTDCSLKAEDSMDVWTCLIASTDDIMKQSVDQGRSAIDRNRWATYLFRYSKADMVGPVTGEAAEMAERIPAPGELITSAQYAMDVDAAKRNVIPKGAVLKFKDSEIPAGWAKASGPAGFIVKL